jgi:hypothetical protein
MRLHRQSTSQAFTLEELQAGGWGSDESDDEGFEVGRWCGCWCSLACCLKSTLVNGGCARDATFDGA